MSKHFSIFLFVILFGCKSTSEFSKTEFVNAKIIRSFTSVANLNHAYFDLKEKNYFEFYRQLFDSVKNTIYEGKYKTVGDTIFLKFNNPEGQKLLGDKAVIKDDKIVFYK